MNIGILGGGQLAKMLTMAAHPLGLRTLCFEPTPDTCANIVTDVVCADFSDRAMLEEFARQVDVVTFETENIPLEVAEFVNKICKVYPNPQAIAVGQDRLHEKEFFKKLGIGTAAFVAINSLLELQQAIAQINLPAVLKTRRMGYDGKGQFVLRTPEDAEKAWETLRDHALILEAFVNFDRELSIIAVRGMDGSTCFYPLVENYHRDGILRLSCVHANDPHLQQQAETLANKVLQELNYVGVLVIELFQVGHKLLVNEMAPRVHNSGHWTMEGAYTSQFENHVRAICDLPLGSTEIYGYSAMVNCIGVEPAITDVLQIPGAHFHTYGKAAKPNRKLGHVTLTALDEKTLEERLESLSGLVEIV